MRKSAGYFVSGRLLRDGFMNEDDELNMLELDNRIEWDNDEGLASD